MEQFAPLKIVIVIGAFLPVPPFKGGAVEKLWLRMAREFVAQGAQVTIFSRLYPGLPASEVDSNGIRHVRVKGYDTPRSMPIRLLRDLLYSLRIRRTLPKDADVVVCNTFWLPAILRGTQRKRAYVDVARMPKGQLRLYRGVGRLRANSRPVADAIRAELPASWHELVEMIPNPLPFSTDDYGNELSRQKVMLYVGRVHPEKGVHLLLAALRFMPMAWPLRIVGPWRIEEGGGGEQYIRQLRKLALGLQVEFPGPIFDTEKLCDEYRRAMLFIYPSLAEKGETFGLAPLEAMAWGCVPVVTDLACFKDFIRHWDNGLTFNHRTVTPERELATCLESICADAEHIESISNQAMLVRTTHSPRVIAETFLRDFEKVATRAGMLSR